MKKKLFAGLLAALMLLPIDSSAEAALENAEHSYFNFDRCGFPLLFTGIFY